MIVHGRAGVGCVALVVAVALAACGSSEAGPSSVTASQDPSAAVGTQIPTSTPRPTVTPTQDPTPAPSRAVIDIRSTFIGALHDPAMKARITMAIRTKLGKAVTTYDGHVEVDGFGHHITGTESAGGRTVAFESTRADGGLFAKSDGLWFAVHSDRWDDSVNRLLNMPSTVRTLGAETRDGVTVHHLVLDDADGFWAAGVLALNGSEVADFAATTDAWALADGTPVAISIRATWHQAVGSGVAQGTRSLVAEFGRFGDATISVKAPDSTWSTFTSRRYGYRIAYPSTWWSEPAVEGYLDAYTGPEGAVFAYRFPTHGASLAEVTAEVRAHTSDFTGIAGAKVHSIDSAKLGPLAARRAVLSGTLDGERYWWVTTYAVKGRWVYWVELRLLAKPSAEGIVLAKTFARTFSTVP